MAGATSRARSTCRAPTGCCASRRESMCRRGTKPPCCATFTRTRDECLYYGLTADQVAVMVLGICAMTVLVVIMCVAACRLHRLGVCGGAQQGCCGIRHLKGERMHELDPEERSRLA